MYARSTVRLRRPADWTGGPHTWARGRAFLDGELLDASRLVAAFESVASAPEEIVGLARRLTGHYSVMGGAGTTAFAVVDRLRGFPVFFARGDEGLLLADDPRELGAENGAAVAHDAIVDFAYTGWVTGTATLIDGVSEVTSASVLTYAGEPDSTVRVLTYGAFEPGIHGVVDLGGTELLDSAYAAHAAAIARFIEIIDGRMLVLPLSGGYDSRLVAMMVKLAGYDRVTCFSYGLPGNGESATSKAVAEALGYEWHFVEYSPDLWSKLVASQEWRDYTDMAHLGVALPMMQGWPSTGELRRRGLVPEDSVFSPGLFIDVCAGYYIHEDMLRGHGATRTDVAQRIVDDVYSQWFDEPARSNDLHGVLARVAETLAPAEFPSPQAAVSALERWYWAERQSKFTGNTIRIYDYWGFDWWLPFVDAEVFDFWQHVSFEQRLDKRLYRRFVLGDIPNRLGAPEGSILRQPKGEDQPARRLARMVDKTGVLRAMRNRLRPRTDPAVAYDTHSLAWWGAIDRETFARQYTGKETIYSFMTQQMMQDHYGWKRGEQGLTR